MHWLQVVAPALAIVLVILIAVLGVAFVSAVEAFQKIFGRHAADEEASDRGRAPEDDAGGEADDRADQG